MNSSLGFGAKRWISTLDRQSERFQSALVSNLPAGDAGGISKLIPNEHKSGWKLNSLTF